MTPLQKGQFLTQRRKGAEIFKLLRLCVEEGIPFLGFTVFPTHRRLKRRKGIAYRRRLKRLLAAYAADEIPLERVTASVQGWVNHLRFGDTWGLRRAVLGALPIDAVPE